MKKNTCKHMEKYLNGRFLANHYSNNIVSCNEETRENTSIISDDTSPMLQSSDKAFKTFINFDYVSKSQSIVNSFKNYISSMHNWKRFLIRKFKEDH